MSGGGFAPRTRAETAAAMGRLSDGHGAGIEFHDVMGGYFTEGFAPGPRNFPSPGGYAMFIPGPMPDGIRDALEEAFAAYRRDAGRGLLPDWLREGLPELERDGFARRGALPEDAAWLFRTQYGLVMVHTMGDRGEGLHRLMWGTGGPAETEAMILFAPDGTLDEPVAVQMFCFGASAALAGDARDAWVMPGADVPGLEEARRDVEELGDAARFAGMELYGRMANALRAGGIPDCGFDPRRRDLAERFRDEECASRRRRAAELGKLDPLERSRPCSPGTWRQRSVPFMDAVRTGRIN